MDKSRHTQNPSDYYDHDAITRAVQDGEHRSVIGGMWDEIGLLQFDFLVSQGLRPHHRLVDIGCGSLRGGVHFAAYLNTANYFGIDINKALLDAGYDRELTPRSLDQRVPRRNLVDTDNFDFSSFPAPFDFALAVSVFTHLPLNTIRTCLERLAPHMAPQGVFFATVFEAAADLPSFEAQFHERGGITTFGDRDPYHYHPGDLRYIAKSAGWEAKWLGAFEHPRNQRMVQFKVL